MAWTPVQGCGGGDVSAGMRQRVHWDAAARDAARAQGVEVAACGRGCGKGDAIWAFKWAFSPFFSFHEH